MYSAQLGKAPLMAAKREARGAILKALEACNRLFLALDREAWQEPLFDSRPSPPDALEQVLQRLVGAVSEQLAATPLALQENPALLEFYFDVLHFIRALEHRDQDFRFELSRSEGRQSLVLRLRCVDAARLLGERQRRPQAVIAFSATASPPRWMLHELGFKDTAVYRSLPSPFRAEQLQVELETSLDIRYRSRRHSLPLLATRIGQWLRRNTGNCIVYFSAYSYMVDVLDRVRPLCGDRTVRVQQRNWREADRAELLDTLRERNDVAAFCILGGVFGEGIDLPGEALRSVVVVGVGLPALSREQNVLRDYYQETLGRGFEYAYQYPGMQRVCQALGRVVRRESDVGRALLIDSRYGDPAYRALLPPWWLYTHPSPADPPCEPPSDSPVATVSEAAGAPSRYR
jgi:DNA excision repair protein ERCC-2